MQYFIEFAIHYVHSDCYSVNEMRQNVIDIVYVVKCMLNVVLQDG